MRDELPSIMFSFGKNGVLVLTPWDYLTEVRDIYKGMRCVLPFTRLDQEWMVLGTAFMQSVYSAFDLERGEASLSLFKD